MCRHELATAQTQYDRETERLSFVLICDDCHTELQRTLGPEYRPNFVPASQRKEA